MNVKDRAPDLTPRAYSVTEPLMSILTILMTPSTISIEEEAPVMTSGLRKEEMFAHPSFLFTRRREEAGLKAEVILG